jgi:hypothetical protein
MTDQLSPGQLAVADQHHAAIPAGIAGAVNRMRGMLDNTTDSDPVFIAQLSAAMADVCDENPHVRSQIAFSYVATMYHLARGGDLDNLRACIRQHIRHAEQQRDSTNVALLYRFWHGRILGLNDVLRLVGAGPETWSVNT